MGLRRGVGLECFDMMIALRKKFYSKLYRTNTLGFSLEYILVILLFTTVNYRNYYSFYYSNITRVYFSENPIVFYSISYCSKL